MGFQYIHGDGRRFVADPTGRYAYRAVEDGKWSEWVTDGPHSEARLDPDGLDLLTEFEAPASIDDTIDRAIQRREALNYRVLAAGTSNVASALEAIGWLGLVSSIAIGIFLIAHASQSYSLNADLGWFVGIGGSIQSLLLIALARLLMFSKATAVLLAENLEEARHD